MRGIAQLGELLNGIQELMGSNPTISAKTISHRHESLWRLFLIQEAG